MAGLSADPSAESRILSAIRDVPRGSVAGYGQIARRAGLPGRARLVARLLSRGGDDSLPWHRILRSDGRIAFPAGSEPRALQVAKLQAEGVDAARGRIDLARYGWGALAGEDLDRWLWARGDR